MPITQHQRKQRQRHLGASDAPAIMVDKEGRSLSPFAGPGDVYWSKVGEQQEDEGTEATRTGDRLEGVLTDYAAEELGVTLQRNQFRVSKQNEILAANFDALVKGKREAVECKYSGQQNADAWGEEGTDQVPDHVWIQCQHQAYVGALDRVWVAAAIAGFQLDWRIYCIPRNDDLIYEIVKRETDFWHTHIVPQVPPQGAELPPMDVLKARHREPGKVIELGDEAVQAWEALEQAKQQKKDAESQVQQCQAAVLTMLDDAEFAYLPNGKMLTYKSQNSAPSVATKQLRADYPEIYNQYVTQGTHRVLRCQNAK